MTYLYLITALFLALCACTSADNTASLLGLRFPAIVLCVIFTVLTLKGFNFI